MMNDAIVERLRQRAHEGEIPCTAAHTVAWEMHVTPSRVGDILNEIGLRVSQCQLGLFGFGPKAEGKSKLLRPMLSLDPQLTEAIQAKAPKGVISCRALWDIAAQQGVERLAAGNTADALGLKVTPCQLKCF